MPYVSTMSVAEAQRRLEALNKTKLAAKPLDADEYEEFKRMIDDTGVLPQVTRPEILDQISLDLLAGLMAYKAAKPDHKFAALPTGSGEFGFRELGAPDCGINTATGRWNMSAPGGTGWYQWFSRTFPATPAPAYAYVYGIENLGADVASRVRIQFGTMVKIDDIWNLVNRPDGRCYFQKGQFGGNGATMIARLQFHTNAAYEYRLLGFYISNGDTLSAE